MRSRRSLAYCFAVALAVPLLSVSCKKDSPKVTAPPSGGTGAFGIVVVNGRQKLYLPQPQLNAAGHGSILVVDVGVAGKGVQGAPAQVTTIDLGTADVATTTNGTSTVILAASTQNRNIWFIDPSNDTLMKTIALDAATAGTSGFSGGGGYVTGIAIDPGNSRAILSVWNGFQLVDLNARSLGATILAAPAENFGFDATNQRIIAPFYDCGSSAAPDGGAPGTCNDYKLADGTVINNGLNIIDLHDNTVYTYLDPTAGTPAQPVGSEPDSAAADSSNGIIIVASEGDGLQNVIDLSKATFDKAKKTVVAPHKAVPGGLTGVAIEPTSHYAFFEEEHGQQIGLVSATAASSGAATKLLLGNMPALPARGGSGVGAWSNIGDPHGIAVTTGLSDGRAVGFLVNEDFSWVARIDLAKMAGTVPTALNELTEAETAPSVTYLDATTRP